MADALALVRAGGIGLLLGAFFFGGLWQTVRRDVGAEHPALWFALSMLVRTGGTLGGFYLLARARPAWLAASLVGFILVQLIATRRARAVRKERTSLASEATDAP